MSQIKDFETFEKRKKDHITWSLDVRSQAGASPSDYIELVHDALPEIDFEEVTLKSNSSIYPNQKPFLVSSMTGGHDSAYQVNELLMKCCDKQNWLFSTGSLRKELQSLVNGNEKELSDWLTLRKKFPKVKLIGNIGLAQVITFESLQIEKLCDKLSLDGLFIHLNPIQEVMQKEGTPQFKGGVDSIINLTESLNIPVLIKETGSGISARTFSKLKETGAQAIDVAGLGGTHWGRVEGLRAGEGELLHKAAHTFKNWGVSTVKSLLEAEQSFFTRTSNQELWASGGLRTGLDAAICIALGAKVCGFAKPLMEAALKSEEAVLRVMKQLEYELKVALFCTGHVDTKSLSEDKEVLNWL